MTPERARSGPRAHTLRIAIGGGLWSLSQQEKAHFLPDGRVLIAGGPAAIAAELYDPGAGMFSLTAPILEAIGASPDSHRRLCSRTETSWLPGRAMDLPYGPPECTTPRREHSPYREHDHRPAGSRPQPSYPMEPS